MFVDGSVPEGGETETRDGSDWWEWNSDYESGKDAQLYYLCYDYASGFFAFT